MTTFWLTRWTAAMIIKHRVVYRKQIDAIKDAIEQWFTEDGEVLVTLESPR